MPLGTLDRTPPPFFRQGPTALSKLAFFSALAIFLMVADLRFALVKPMRTVLSTALYPVQWLVMQPIEATRQVGHYFESQTEAQAKAAKSQLQLAQQSARALQVDQLTLENQRLRALLARLGK